MTMSTGIRRCLPIRVSSTWMISFPSSSGMRGRIGDFSHLAAHETRSLFEHALVELFITLARGANVDIEVVYFCAGAFMDQMGKF